MRVAAIMPCRGRVEQTVANVRRLLATAGDVEWRMIAMVSETFNLGAQLAELGVSGEEFNRRLPYWDALSIATRFTTEPLIANLANDLLPGQHWLRRAVEAFDATFPDGYGMLGFNDGHWTEEHSPHFLISRALLADLGGWPTWYDHNYGDTELCQRAMALGVYAKAPWAVLYHDHPYYAAGNDDSVYQEGRRSAERDRLLYEQRKAAGWPTVSPS